MIDFSLEFFPTQNSVNQQQLDDTIDDLKHLNPIFASVTQNTGKGKTALDQEKTLHQIRNKLPLAAHTTCSGSTKDETISLTEAYIQQGIQSIVAIRGDHSYAANKQDCFANSLELVQALRPYPQLEIYVGAYPETHKDAIDADKDLDWLKRKFDAGADAAISQFFFDVDTFLRFRDRCVKAGIHQKIIPGILPIHNFEKLTDFVSRCGATIPNKLRTRFLNCQDKKALAIEIATVHSARLIHSGVDHLHFYTLNRSELTLAITNNLGYQKNADLRKVG